MTLALEKAFKRIWFTVRVLCAGSELCILPGETSDLPCHYGEEHRGPNHDTPRILLSTSHFCCCLVAQPSLTLLQPHGV